MVDSRPIPPPPTARPSRGPGTPTRRADHSPAVVDVTVTAVGDREVEVRLADGRTGAFERADLAGAAVAVGDALRAAVLARDDPRGRVRLSVAWGRKQDAWTAIDAAVAAKGTLTGTVTGEVKGGLVVDVGVRAFLPVSLVGAVEGGPKGLVGTKVEVAVTEADRETGRLVVSRRDVQRRERRDEEKAAWAALQVGQRRTGRVVAVLDYGAKVEIGPLAGLVHRSELSWNRIGQPSDVVAVGDEVEVVVQEISRSKRRISLSMRAASAHPFEGIEEGRVYEAVITRVLDYGAFAHLEGTGAEGLVHVSEISELPGQRADQLVVPGERVPVRVLTVDRERNRLALSIRQAVVED